MVVRQVAQVQGAPNMTGGLSDFLAGSVFGRLAEFLLSSVPGMPPILQTLHLLSICSIMASAAFVSLRILGLAVPSQQVSEMVQRLQPWTWYGVAGASVSGVWFVLARPERYFDNPVFQIKFTLLFFAVLFSVMLYRVGHGDPTERQISTALRLKFRLLAGVVLLLWVTVLLAGRWIAYAEYLFW